MLVSKEIGYKFHTGNFYQKRCTPKVPPFACDEVFDLFDGGFRSRPGFCRNTEGGKECGGFRRGDEEEGTEEGGGGRRKKSVRYGSNAVRCGEVRCGAVWCGVKSVKFVSPSEDGEFVQ